MIVEIFLAFTLFGGVVRDVDAFVDRDVCLADLARGRQNLAAARLARPEYAAVTIVGCIPVLVEAPKAPAAETNAK